MLVIVSDLHLTDGTSGSTISAGAFQLLAERIHDLALGASWRADGCYRPIERIDLVLLGDVLDVIRSTSWLGGEVRPWDDPHSESMIGTVAAISGEILRRNEEAFRMLRLLAQGSVELQPANQLGRPANTATRQPVPVRIHYMVGNHDWFLHLPGENYNRLRRQIAVHMGLATCPDAPFPHEAWESNELLQVLRRHKVFARHGDVYDPFNFEGERDASSLGDVIVIELLNRFGREIERQMGDELPASTLAGLREIDNIRPLLLIPVWIDGLLDRTCPQPASRKRVKQIWDQLADEFLEQPFVRQRDTWCPVDIVDGLQKAIKFSRRLSVGWASWISKWICELRGARSKSYAEHALVEQDFRNRRAKHIVYGHTHYAETVPLDASFAEGYALHQIYFNSGTWRRIHRQTRLAPSEHEFIPADTMTYLVFYQGDERKGRPYETWSGTLGLGPSPAHSYRVDPGVIADAPREPIRSPINQPGAPHFTLSTLASTTAGGQ